MAEYGDQYGNQMRKCDEYGNPVRQTDEYGNPMHQGGTMGEYGTTGATTGAHGTQGGRTGAHETYGTGTTGAYATEPGTGVGMEQGKEHRGLGGMFHRSGSSGSSSSEDDGQGGRRKKGMKGKLPGGQPGQEYSSATTAPGYGREGGQQEKKGIMEKIKEKLPGGHHN